VDFNFSEDQTMLRDSVARYLQDRYDFDTRRKVVASESGWRPEVWKAFAEELGILGAPFSEAHGGFGGGPIENMIVMEEIGKALVVEPYLSTVVIGGGFLKHSGFEGAADLIGSIIGGETVIAFAYAEPQGRYNLKDLKTTAKKAGDVYEITGHKAVVWGAPWSTHLIVTARTGGGQKDEQGIGVFLVEKGAKGLSARDYPTVDGSKASEVYFEGTPATLIAEDAWPLVEQVVDEAIAALCAESVGVQRKLHEGTLDYTRQRKQFGVPIASFQVLQHRMVDMFMNLEQSVSMTYMATLKLGESPTERGLAVSSAKVHIGRANKFLGQNAIQLHGGMGMTDELAIGHYFKRATMIEGLFGSVDHHLKRYETLSFGEAA